MDKGLMSDWPLAKIAFFMGYSSPMDSAQEAAELNPGHGISWGALNPMVGNSTDSGTPPAGSSAFDSLIGTPIVPIDHATELVSRDQYMSQEQKGQVLNILNGVQSDGGKASITDLTASAMRLGLQGAAGAVVGYGMGKLFGLPKETTRMLSVTGGLANALAGLGII